MPFKFAERKSRNKEKGKGNREEMGSFGVEDSERAEPRGSSTERREAELSLPIGAGKEVV